MQEKQPLFEINEAFIKRIYFLNLCFAHMLTTLPQNSNNSLEITRISKFIFLNYTSHNLEQKKNYDSYPEVVFLSALITCNAMNWPGSAAVSFIPYYWLMLCTLGQDIVNLQWNTTSDGFLSIFTFSLWILSPQKNTLQLMCYAISSKVHEYHSPRRSIWFGRESNVMFCVHWIA